MGQNFEHALSALHKHAIHEYFYARKDGPQELKERQEEYARKERDLVAKFKRLANSTRSHVEDVANATTVLDSPVTVAYPTKADSDDVKAPFVAMALASSKPGAIT